MLRDEASDFVICFRRIYSPFLHINNVADTLLDHPGLFVSFYAVNGVSSRVSGTMSCHHNITKLKYGSAILTGSLRCLDPL